MVLVLLGSGRRKVRFFGHLTRTTPEEHHHHFIAAALRPPADWKRPVGRPRNTWLRTMMIFNP